MKQIINALSNTQAVNDWLENTRHPRILHIFDRVCNLINEGREVLSVVTSQIGNGPFNLVVGDDVLFSDEFNVEVLISIHDNQLQIGELAIDISNAKLWNPRPDWEGLYTNKGRIFDQLSTLSIPGAEPLLPMVLISDLSAALATADIESGKSLASQLAGFGMGLTPAGDDIIMGAIYATWIVHLQEVASVIANEIAETAAPLTTSLSAAWLRSVGKGEAGEVWHDLFDSLVSSDNLLLQEAVDNILTIGETSGADALAGFIEVCSAAKEHMYN